MCEKLEKNMNLVRFTIFSIFLRNSIIFQDFLSNWPDP